MNPTSSRLMTIQVTAVNPLTGTGLAGDTLYCLTVAGTAEAFELRGAEKLPTLGALAVGQSLVLTAGPVAPPTAPAVPAGTALFAVGAVSQLNDTYATVIYSLYGDPSDEFSARYELRGFKSLDAAGELVEYEVVTLSMSMSPSSTVASPIEPPTTG